MKGKIEKVSEELEIQGDIEVTITPGRISLKKGSNESARDYSGISIKKEGNKIVLSADKSRRKERRDVMTNKAHISNMIKGLNEVYIYKLKVCAVHFPMSVSVDDKTKELIIKNFLGEKKSRKAKILPGVKVEVKGDEITVESHNKEAAGQTAANFETATKIRLRDRRIFQDGIFMTKKAGKKI